MVGAAVTKKLRNYDCKLITVGREELNLVNQKAVHEWMEYNKPDAIIMAAAKVGGIQANNNFPVNFLYENLMIEAGRS